MKAERARRDMPQQHVITVLAFQHGIRWHQSTVTKVEAGERPVRLAEALAVASILHVSLEDLLDEPGSPDARRRWSERLKGRLEELARMNWDTRIRSQELMKLLDEDPGGNGDEVDDGEHQETP